MEAVSRDDVTLKRHDYKYKTMPGSFVFNVLVLIEPHLIDSLLIRLDR